jgi:hypothetical protein
MSGSPNPSASYTSFKIPISIDSAGPQYSVITQEREQCLYLSSAFGSSTSDRYLRPTADPQRIAAESGVDVSPGSPVTALAASAVFARKASRARGKRFIFVTRAQIRSNFAVK